MEGARSAGSRRIADLSGTLCSCYMVAGQSHRADTWHMSFAAAEESCCVGALAGRGKTG